MGAPVRLIATDLDGTLLRTDHTISPRTRAAIAAATEAGIAIVPATGRGWRSATPLLAEIAEIEVAVCSNGALTRDLRRSCDLHTTPLAPGAYAAAIACIRETLPGAGLFWERLGSRHHDETYARLRPHVRRDFGADVDGIPDEADDVLKVLVCHADHDEAGLLAILSEVLPPGVTVSFSGGDLVEVTGAGVHKAAALARLCADRGIDRTEVIALGDNQNDVTMLAWAGRGIAMGNARPEALAVADEATAHHMDDGVAVVIEAVLADRAP